MSYSLNSVKAGYIGLGVQGLGFRVWGVLNAVIKGDTRSLDFISCLLPSA